MMVLPISVLIPTMNRAQSLKKTITSYLSCEYIPAQFVVVDQSTDIRTRQEIQTMLAKMSSVDIKYIFQEVPSSSAARNRALEEADCEIIVFSDDDIDVNEDTLKNLHDIMQDASVALIAGIDENSAKSFTNIGYLLGTKSFKNRKIGHVTLSMLGRYPDNIIGQIETQWAMGYFFAVRKSLVQRWNVQWDENLTGYAYAEDLDFSYNYYKHAKGEGMRCILNERVRVKHLVSMEYRIPSRKSTFMYVLNRAYLSYKHQMGRGSRMAMKWCNFWRMIERAIRRQNLQDMRDACQYLKRHRKEVEQGIFPEL